MSYFMVISLLAHAPHFHAANFLKINLKLINSLATVQPQIGPLIGNFRVFLKFR